MTLPFCGLDRGRVSQGGAGPGAIVLHREREKPHSSCLPHHLAYGRLPYIVTHVADGWVRCQSQERSVRTSSLSSTVALHLQYGNASALLP